MGGENTTLNFAGECSRERSFIKDMGKRVLEIKNSINTRPEVVGQDKGEMIANVTLAYRHLEDAAMRLGKAIQAYEGGQSIYDSNDAARVAGNGPVEAGAYAPGKVI